MDNWSEFWFPVKDIGGISAVAHEAVLHLTQRNGTTTIGLNALQPMDHTLRISRNGTILREEEIRLQPMDTQFIDLGQDSGQDLEIVLLGTTLEYHTDPRTRRLERPFHVDKKREISKNEKDYQSALEAIEYREYQDAYALLDSLLTRDPSHRARSLTGRAAIPQSRL